jgi:hypothetical protein
LVQPQLTYPSPSKARMLPMDQPRKFLCLSYLLITRGCRLLKKFSNQKPLTKIVVVKIRALSARRLQSSSCPTSLRLPSPISRAKPGLAPRSTCSSCRPYRTCRRRGQYRLSIFRRTLKFLKSPNRQIFHLEQKSRPSTNTNS